MGDASVLSMLRDLETRLLRAEVRSDPAQLGALLHPDFYEVGANGRVYTRYEVLTEFQGAGYPYTVWAQDFQLQVVASGVALLGFRSAHVADDGALSRHVARTSLWQYVGSTWLLRFHQGTLTQPFDRHAT